MGLLSEIQKTVTSDTAKVSSALLKVQLLASKLGSPILSEWVSHESQGYPPEIPIPNYRKLIVSFYGTFSGALGSGVNNAAIPSYLIKKHAGEDWINFDLRSSMSEIDALVNDSDGTLQINNASNLILLLNGKIYPDLTCIEVIGKLSSASLASIQHAVKSKILEFTIELEKSFPEALDINIENINSIPEDKKKDINNMVLKIVHGNNTEIFNSGDNNSIQVNISSGNIQELTTVLNDAGIPKKEAEELSAIIAAEEPESQKEPLGKKAQKWLGKNISKAINGTWKIGASALSGVLTAAAKQYYGLD
ncbi:MAG: hypothetical protein COB56_01295 [Robiginitomaculum sp.]|nr:MAG: hypothetical protein COB56_01295 [Robiginitomaculum sp.]